MEINVTSLGSSWYFSSHNCLWFFKTIYMGGCSDSVYLLLIQNNNQ